MGHRKSNMGLIMKTLSVIILCLFSFFSRAASPSFQQVTNIHNALPFTLDQVAIAGDPSTNKQNIVTWGSVYANLENATNGLGNNIIFAGDQLSFVSFFGLGNGWTVSGTGVAQRDGFYWQHFSTELSNLIQNDKPYAGGFLTGFLPEPITGFWTMVDGDLNVIATNNDSSISAGTWNQANGSGLNNGFTVALGGGQVAATTIGDFRIGGDVIATGTNSASVFSGALNLQTNGNGVITPTCFLYITNSDGAVYKLSAEKL